MTPLCVDLCCGLGGVAEGFLSAGYEVVGYDIQDHGYPGEIRVQDVREVDSIVTQWEGQRITVLWASPPCNEVSLRDLPWGRNQKLLPPDLSIFEACFELGRRLNPRVFILENVRGAQPWIGRAPLHRGPYYFWGDVALLPALRPGHIKKERKTGSLVRAKIPFELSYGLAMACRGG